MASQPSSTAEPVSSTTTANSTVPVLGEGFSESKNVGSHAPAVMEGLEPRGGEGDSEIDPVTGLRRFLPQGKNKRMEHVPAALNPISPPASNLPTTTNQTATHAPASPSRNAMASPPMLSPASSLIFERNVQEDGLATTASPAIPSHITTENHIPPVLDAASMSITDSHLDPDNVEIVTHAAHQPAALTVTGVAAPINQGQPPMGPLGSPFPTMDDVIAEGTLPSNAGPANPFAEENYASLDNNDVRRLSFISFADVVHAEHADHSSLSHSTVNSPTISSPLAARSPSPMRSPASPPLSGSFTSQEAAGHKLDQSPVRGLVPTSPEMGVHSHSPPNVGGGGGELTIETMRQALRKTGSRDLSGYRHASGSMSDAGGNVEGGIHSSR